MWTHSESLFLLNPMCDCNFTGFNFTRFRLTIQRTLWLAWPVGLLASITQEEVGFIIKLLSYLPFILSRRPSFSRGSCIWLFVSILPMQWGSTIFTASLFFFSRLIVLVIFVFCTIFPCYANVSASSLLAVGSFEKAHLAFAFSVVIFTFI